MDHKKIREFIDNEEHHELLPFVCTIQMDTGDIYRGVIVNLDKTIISFIDIAKMKNISHNYSIFLDAFKKRDIDTLLKIYADDAVYTA